MIDPKELRIGNYVKSLKNNSNLCFGGNLPFWEVTIDDMLHILNNPKNYEPIPLTEDWLIKFGFEYDTITWYKGSIVLAAVNQQKGYQIYINTLTYGIVDKQIYYVNDLQNLYFAITGEELIYNENHK